MSTKKEITRNNVDLFKTIEPILKYEDREKVSHFIARNEIQPNWGYANLICSYPGTGKSYYCRTELLPKFKDKVVVYLVGNTDLKDSLLEKNDGIRFRDLRENEEQFKLGIAGVYLETYCSFGKFLAMQEEKGRWTNTDNVQHSLRHVEILILDEAHTLVQYAEMFRSNYSYDNSKKSNSRDYEGATETGAEFSNGHYYFLKLIPRLLGEYKKKVMVLTATPDRVSNHWIFKDLLHTMVAEGDVQGYSPLEIRQFNSYTSITKEQLKGKALIYTQQISTMREIKTHFEAQGLSVIELWSNNAGIGQGGNTANRLREDQKTFKKRLLTTGEVDGYDVIIINSAIGCGVDIEHTKDSAKAIQTVILYSCNSTEIVQAYGRIRHDIDLLYVKNKDVKDEEQTQLIVPEKYLDRWILKEERDEMLKSIPLKNTFGRTLSWARLKKNIDDFNHYAYMEKRQKHIDPETGKESKPTKYYIMTNTKF